MARTIAYALLIGAFSLSGCKKVEVYDVDTYANSACVAHERSAEHPNPIECFGVDQPNTPIPSDATLFSQWMSGLQKPVSLALLGGVCVVDEGESGKGEVKCIDKFSPLLTGSRLLSETAKTSISPYDFERIEYAYSSSIQLDYLGCGMADALNGAGKTLVCWTKGTNEPRDLVAEDMMFGELGDITEITDFSLASNQLCILGKAGAGAFGACMEPAVVESKVTFINVNQNINIAASKVAAGGLMSVGEVEQRFCYTSTFNDVGCEDPALASIPAMEYTGIWMGPKASAYFRINSTMCASTSNGLECSGYYSPSILTEDFRAKAKGIKKVVISDDLACFTAKPGARTGLHCQGHTSKVNIPAHLSL